MTHTTTDSARAALEEVDRARANLGAQVGLPTWYWWLLAVGWVVLGALGEFTPAWLAIAATVAFGAGNAVLAGRLYDGTRGQAGVQLRRSQVGRALPWLVIGLLAVLVGVTVGSALLLSADGAEHAGLLASVFVAAIVGFGGPRLLAGLRRMVRA